MDQVKYIFEKPALTGKVTRWQMILTEYDIQYTSQKAIKGSVLSDYLAEQPIDDYQPIRFDFPDEDIMFLKSKDWEEPLPEEGPDPESKWVMMFDGAVHVNGRGVGVVLITPEGGSYAIWCQNNFSLHQQWSRIRSLYPKTWGSRQYTD